MKKDKEWLKDEIKKEGLKNPTYHDARDNLIKIMVPMHSVFKIIDQLDEPEMTEDQAWNKIAEFYPENIMRLKNGFEHWYYGRMGEPETLSQEWIDENSYGAYELDGTLCDNGERFVSEKDLQNLLVPKQEEKEITLEHALNKIAESLPMSADEVGLHFDMLNKHGGKVTYGEPEEPVFDHEEYLRTIKRTADAGCLTLDGVQYELIERKKKLYRFEQEAYMEQDFRAYSFEEAKKLAEKEWIRMFRKEGLFGETTFIEEVEEMEE